VPASHSAMDWLRSAKISTKRAFRFKSFPVSKRIEEAWLTGNSSRLVLTFMPTPIMTPAPAVSTSNPAIFFSLNKMSLGHLHLKFESLVIF